MRIKYNQPFLTQQGICSLLLGLLLLMPSTASAESALRPSTQPQARALSACFAGENNFAPTVGQISRLYDGALNTLPSSQGEFSYFTDPFFGPSATHVAANGYTTLDTTPDTNDKAGYFHSYPAVVNDPLLDRSTGYAVLFQLQMLSENHVSANRAGFSMIAISSDGANGLEVGFWEDEVWAYEDTPLFVKAEGAVYDTTAAMTPYMLSVRGDYYALSAAATEIFSGTLRDYSAFSGTVDPYENPNFLFFGDDTSSADAESRLASIAVVVDATPIDRATVGRTPVTIDDLGILDVDAGSSAVQLTLSADHGTMTVDDSITNGLAAGDIAGNGSDSVIITAPVGKINATLASAAPLMYQSDLGFVGTDTVTALLDDLANCGVGGNNTNSESFSITVSQLAGTAVWDGGGSTANWSEAANWVGDTVPTAGDSVIFGSSGSDNSTIDGAFSGTVANLFIDASYVGTLTHAAALSVTNTLSQTGSILIVDDVSLLQVGGSVAHDGGRMQQTGNVNGSSRLFLQIEDQFGTVMYRGAEISSTNNLGNVTVDIAATSTDGTFCTTSAGASPAYTQRCFDITPTNDLAATVRLWSTTAELNGIASGDLAVYRFVDPNWTELITGVSNGVSGDFAFVEADTPGFSSFLMGASGQSPTAVTMADTTAGSTSGVMLWLILFASTLLITNVWLLYRRRESNIHR